MDKILKAADDILNRFDPGIGWLDSERADVVKILKQLVGEEFTSTNNEKKCLCGNEAIAHFCSSCLKVHDQYCKIPF
jgi:hypothetical protein